MALGDLGVFFFFRSEDLPVISDFPSMCPARVAMTRQPGISQLSFKKPVYATRSGDEGLVTAVTFCKGSHSRHAKQGSVGVSRP